MSTASAPVIAAPVAPASTGSDSTQGSSSTPAPVDKGDVSAYIESLKSHAKDDAKTEVKKGEKDAVKEIEDLSKAPKKVEAKEEKEAPKEEKREAVNEKIKIGDKEYSKPELEKEFSSLKSSNESLTKKIDQIDSTIDQFLSALKTNKDNILDKLDIPQDVIMNYYFEKYVEPATLTAEQKLDRMEKAEAARKAKEQETTQKSKAEKEIADKQALERHFTQQWETKINQSVVDAGLPQTDWVKARMAGYMNQALEKNLNNIEPKDVVELVKQDLVQLQKSLLSSMTPEQLAETLGEDGLKKVRSHDTNKFKNTKFENKNPGEGKVERKKDPSKRFSNVYDLLE